MGLIHDTITSFYSPQELPLKLPLTEWAFLYPTRVLSTAGSKFWVLSEWYSEFRSKFPRKCRGNEICSKRLNCGCIEIIIPNWIQSLGVIFLVTEHLLYIVRSMHLCPRNGYVLPFPHTEEIPHFLLGLILYVALWEFHGWPECPLTLYLPPREHPCLYISDTCFFIHTLSSELRLLRFLSYKSLPYVNIYLDELQVLLCNNTHWWWIIGWKRNINT